MWKTRLASGFSSIITYPLIWASGNSVVIHDDVIKWKHFPRYWLFVREIHRSPVNSPHKGQWRGALMFTLICVWINDWVNNREAGDLRRQLAHSDVSVMPVAILCAWNLDPSVHLDAIMQINIGLPLGHHCVLASASVVPATSQCTCGSRGLPVCSNYAN